METPSPQPPSQELPPVSPPNPEQLLSQQETAQQLGARLTEAWDRQAARIATAATDGTIPPDHLFVREYNLLQDAKKGVNGNTFNENDQSFTIDGADADGNPIKQTKNERESIDPFFDAVSKLPEEEQGRKDIALLKENAKVYVEGQGEPISYSSWEANGKQPPAERFDLLASRPKVKSLEQQGSTTAESATSNAPEVDETKENFVAQLRKDREIQYRTITNGFDVEFDNMLPSDSRKVNEANPGYAREIIQKGRPGARFENPKNMTDTAVLTDQYQQNEIMRRTLDQSLIRLGEPITPEQRAEANRLTGEVARINGEQERIKGYLGNTEPDISPVDAMFNNGGILSTPEQQAKFLKYNVQVKQQWDNFAQQNESFKKGVAASFTLPNGKEIIINKKDIEGWASTAAMITGLSMFLLYMEGDKENQQQGRSAGH